MSFSPESISAQHAKGRLCARAERGRSQRRNFQRGKERSSRTGASSQEGKCEPLKQSKQLKQLQQANFQAMYSVGKHSNWRCGLRREGVVCFVIQATSGMLPCGFCPRVLGRCLSGQRSTVDVFDPLLSSFSFRLGLLHRLQPAIYYPSDTDISCPVCIYFTCGTSGTSGRERCNDTLGPFIKHARRTE